MANDFSGDSDVIALYNFENGALTDDSKNTNDLTNVNSVTADTVNYKQGLASALMDNATDNHFSILDSALQSDFPLKSGTSNTVFSIIGWFRIADVISRKGVVCKYETDGRRSLAMQVREDEAVTIFQGYDSGASAEFLYTSSTSLITLNVWYNFKLTYNNGAWALRIWDDNSSSIILSVSGTATNAISVLAVPWSIGSYRPSVGNNNFDGNIDETVFFKRIVSDADHDEIIAGTYSAGGAISLDAESGSYTLTGSDVSTPITRLLSAETGAYSLTGSETGITLDRILSGESGAFVLTGADVEITISLDKTVNAESGSYNLTGSEVNIVKDAILNAETGAFNLTGAEVDILKQVVLSAESGAYSLTGADTDIKKTSVLNAESGSYVLTGSDVSIVWSGAAVIQPPITISMVLSVPNLSMDMSVTNITMEMKV